MAKESHLRRLAGFLIKLSLRASTSNLMMNKLRHHGMSSSWESKWTKIGLSLSFTLLMLLHSWEVSASRSAKSSCSLSSRQVSLAMNAFTSSICVVLKTPDSTRKSGNNMTSYALRNISAGADGHLPRGPQKPTKLRHSTWSKSDSLDALSPGFSAFSPRKISKTPTFEENLVQMKKIWRSRHNFLKITCNLEIAYL